MPQKRPNMPTQIQITKYWAPKIVKLKPHLFKCPEHISSGDYCFACGLIVGGLHRAHIKARSEGGPDTVENLHMLCTACHLSSEMLKGKAYKKWFLRRTHADTLMDMFYKTDYEFFRTFRSRAKKCGLDIWSIKFLRRFNRLLRVVFDFPVKKPGPKITPYMTIHRELRNALRIIDTEIDTHYSMHRRADHIRNMIHRVLCFIAENVICGNSNLPVLYVDNAFNHAMLCVEDLHSRLAKTGKLKSIVGEIVIELKKLQS